MPLVKQYEEKDDDTRNSKRQILQTSNMKRLWTNHGTFCVWLALFPVSHGLWLAVDDDWWMPMLFQGHYGHNRAISVREVARLQSFPDDFVFSDSLTALASQIGNAVPIDLVKASKTMLKKAMFHIMAKRSKRGND